MLVLDYFYVDVDYFYVCRLLLAYVYFFHDCNDPAYRLVSRITLFYHSFTNEYNHDNSMNNLVCPNQENKPVLCYDCATKIYIDVRNVISVLVGQYRSLAISDQKYVLGISLSI